MQILFMYKLHLWFFNFFTDLIFKQYPNKVNLEVRKIPIAHI